MSSVPMWVLVVGVLSGPSNTTESAQEQLSRALTFHAGFDDTTDAAFAHGDPRIHTALKGKTEEGEVGLKRDDIDIVKNGGHYGGALRFRDSGNGFVYYQAQDNVYYRRKNWSGTMSIWLSLNPEKDLKPVYSDPLQVTDKKWNDASIWLDFSKDDKPRHFRLGVMSDEKLWNPQGLKWDDIPDKDRPLLTVKKPPFGSGRWTHIAITFSRFNNDSRSGRVHLYINGEPQGEMNGRRQVLSWSPKKATIRLGINYIGLMDDVAMFSRSLSAEEVKILYTLPHGVASLTKKR